VAAPDLALVEQFNQGAVNAMTRPSSHREGTEQSWLSAKSRWGIATGMIVVAAVGTAIAIDMSRKR
jgi:hypothetical protein